MPAPLKDLRSQARAVYRYISPFASIDNVVYNGLVLSNKGGKAYTAARAKLYVLLRWRASPADIFYVCRTEAQIKRIRDEFKQIIMLCDDISLYLQEFAVDLQLAKKLAAFVGDAVLFTQDFAVTLRADPGTCQQRSIG